MFFRSFKAIFYDIYDSAYELLNEVPGVGNNLKVF